jgi:hypothetical protein
VPLAPLPAQPAVLAAIGGALQSGGGAAAQDRILSERVRIAIGLESNSIGKIQGMFDLNSKFDTNFFCFLLLFRLEL